ncbi:MAG: hypothetical protein K940chlam9_00538 [Chlamydiae bacterium]|nr:hypothetical protein [Chlamydiota bacterium]
MNINPCSHAFRGIVRGAQAGAAYTGMALTVLLVATAVLGLFAGDVLIVYHYARDNLVNLVWAVPLGLGFMALDLYFSFLIRNASRIPMRALHQFAQNGCDGMHRHFSQVSTNVE